MLDKGEWAVRRGEAKIFMPKNIFTKNISEKNIFTKNIFEKGGGEAPLLPAGPRLISSDSEISA